MSNGAHKLDASGAKAFLLAGKAFFTVVSAATGARFTYRVSVGNSDDSPHFVSTLTGPDNTSHYQFLGTVFHKDRYFHGRKSKIAKDAPCARAFEFLWRMLRAEAEFPESFEFWHEGRCGKCGRPLTVPGSIELGLGPVCAKAAA